MTCHARPEFLAPKIATFSQFQVVFKCQPGEANDTSYHFYPVISYRRVRKEEESGELLYTVRSLVMVREISCQRKGLIKKKKKKKIKCFFFFYRFTFISNHPLIFASSVAFRGQFVRCLNLRTLAASPCD